MTVKTHPVHLFGKVCDHWIANPEAMDFTSWVAKPGRPLPSEAPGGETGATETTWTWIPDLTTAEEAEWDDLMVRLGNDGTGMPTEAAIDGLISTMKSFKDRTGEPSNAQLATTLDAVIDYIRYIELRLT